ncbi:unnamed protein product [Paramecium sonneborni]|uniref:Uncharacterized protein n=1 Tax=Paramecium sonneborni TaxID=65129 RepID=A0A8S1NYC8_9CILI|nr:unnamed protein product [Paramecium sonneborni]
MNFFFEQSFGKQDPFQKTAQFFNPEVVKSKQQMLKRRRENSLPQQNLAAIKTILQKTKLLQKNPVSRKTTLHSIKDSNKENLCNQQSTKQSTKQSTQQSTQDVTEISNTIFNFLDQNIKQSSNQFIPLQYESCKPIKKQSLLQYNSQNANQLENNSQIQKISNSQEKKRTIKVKDPYGIFTQQTTTSVPRKHSSKSFVNQKAQIKLVDRIFSSRSDSLQE